MGKTKFVNRGQIKPTRKPICSTKTIETYDKEIIPTQITENLETNKNTYGPIRNSYKFYSQQIEAKAKPNSTDI